jgi:hypothetical protein
MNAFKWENLKDQIAREIYTKIDRGVFDASHIAADILASNFAVFRDLPENWKDINNVRRAYADKAYDTIKAWDVRAVGRLRDLFPKLFPAAIRKGVLTADVDAKGVWWISRHGAA